jgi:hypothetical protein
MMSKRTLVVSCVLNKSNSSFCDFLSILVIALQALYLILLFLLPKARIKTRCTVCWNDNYFASSSKTAVKSSSFGIPACPLLAALKTSFCSQSRSTPWMKFPKALNAFETYCSFIEIAFVMISRNKWAVRSL